ncbi:MAG: hybrid sensor histidine kinase/response regulator [Magnetococcales bacterium]|nr:hybrid sensor histidine kinase/response regulator [Magnetococcales bacterium]
MRIFIIDDNREFRQLLAHALAPFGWEAVPAASGEEALTLYESNHREMDVVLLDHIMPGMDGLYLLPKLLAINPQVPIIMMTSYGSIPLVTEFMQQGGSGFIEKPPGNFTILKLRIEEAIREGQRKREIEAMRAAQQSMARLNQDKDLFLANMSHELRTPLTAILHFAVLAKRKWTESRPEEAMAMLDGLLAGKERLLRFVSNIEYLARIHVGEWHCQPVQNDLMHLVRSVLEEVEPCFAPKNVRWRVTGASTVSACFDAPSLRIILTELLDNAGKFSPPGGGVDLIVAESGGTAQIAIRDAGPGIPAGEEEIIFSPFVESSLTRSEAGGTGLGLALVHGLLQQCGGQILVANRPEGQGVEVTLLLTDARRVAP